MAKSRFIDLNLDMVYFVDGKDHYYFIPAFDLIGAGRTKKQAYDSIQIVVEEYIRYTTENNTLVVDLIKCGWFINTEKNIFIPPKFNFMSNNNNELAEIVTTKDFSKTTQSIQLPQLQHV